MKYLLILLFLVNGEWVEADTDKWPPQPYETAEECLESEHWWNEFIAIPASENIGPNIAVCIMEVDDGN